MTTVEQAYAEVERVTRARARNFAYGIMLLPREKRRAVAAIYAFAREVDDIADDPARADDDKRARLEVLRGRLDDDSSSEPMLVALADARRRFAIPTAALHDLIDGGLQDTVQQRYASFDELHAYCRKVAGAVGVACVAVYGPDGRAAPVREADQGRGVPGGTSKPSTRVATELPTLVRSEVETPKASTGRGFPPARQSKTNHLAETLGVALQLINIIRDVREDWELGRVYLPQDELAAHGVVEEDIAFRRRSDAWRALMAFEASRARAFLAEGRSLLPLLDRRSAACVATFANLYEATLDRIEADGFDVFSGPPRLSSLTKLRLAGAGLVR